MKDHSITWIWFA